MMSKGCRRLVSTLGRRLSVPAFISASFLAMTVACPLSAAGASRLYLKPVGSVACAQPDGQTWATAFTNVEDVIQAALSSGACEIYAAGGLYAFPARYALGQGSDLAIYGGFPGVSEAETTGDRDPVRHETVFSGDVDFDDYWVHCDTNATYGITQTELKDSSLFSGGRLVMPPPYAGAYDTYCAKKVGTATAGAFSITGGSLRLDGVTFAGFYLTGTWGSSDNPNNLGPVIALIDGSLDIEGCRFVGNTCGQGIIYSKRSFTMSNSEILHVWGTSRGVGVTLHDNGVATIRQCRFRSVARASSTSSQFFSSWAGAGSPAHFVVDSCEMSRFLLGMGASCNELYGGPANVFGGEGAGTALFRNCVISNCYSATSHAAGAPMMSGRGQFHLLRTLVSDNLYVCRPASGASYCLFSRMDSGGNRNSFDGVTFAGNVVRAQDVAAEYGSYALGIVGNRMGGLSSALLNCTFDANAAAAPEKAGVRAVLSRGVVQTAMSSTQAQMGLANCTFVGPARPGLHDVVLFGTSHARDLTVVNCLFDATTPGAWTPLLADVPSRMRLVCCSILDCRQAPAGMSCEGLAFDKVPLEKAVVDAKTGRYVYVPAAKVPGLRETCLVATNAPAVPQSWAFCRPGSETWEPLNAGTGLNGAAFAASLVTDAAADEARPASGFTRGAVQRLTETAENGKSLVARVEPPMAGTLSEMRSQAFAADGAMLPVTATLTNAPVFAFDGWYGASGEKLSDSATLTGYRPSGDMEVVTARFVAPPVELVFDLGAYGTFDANGQSRLAVTASPGTVFPAVPPHTILPGWHFLGFDVPAFVPPASATYVAKAVTTEVRTIFVTPEGAGRRDGSDWENAYGDVAAAYADAAAYRGEVWLKKGVYRLKTPLTARSNVTVRGGFAGAESDADEADPDRNSSILSGDANGDDGWTCGSGGRGPTWLDGAYCPPNPDRADPCWKPTANIGENVETAFYCTGVVTNFSLDGIVLTGFRDGAVVLSEGDCDKAVLRRCRFLANNGGASTSVEQHGALRLSRSCLLEDCVFDGNCDAVSAVPLADGETLTVRRCVFSNNSAGTYGGGGLHVGKRMALDLSYSRFCRNYGDWHGYQPASSLALREAGPVSVADCTFEEDLNVGTSHGAVVFWSLSGRADFIRCRFERNALVSAASTWYSESGMSACISVLSGSRTVLLRDCLFAGNRMSLGGGRNEEGFAVALYARGVRAQVLNSTFVDQEIATAKETDRAGVIMTREARLALVGCTLKDTSLSGVSSAVADVFVMGNGAEAGVLNTLMASARPGYRAIVADSTTWTPTLANSVVQGFDVSAFEPLKENGYVADVVTEGVSDFMARPMTNAAGVVALGVRGRGPVRGRPVWLMGESVYFHDAAANTASPWRKAGERASFAASVEGLDLRTPLLPDAFGRRRTRSGGCSCGPLEQPLGLAVLVR